MTFTGPRSYVVGESEVAVIDPAPDDPRHLDALAAAVAGEREATVLVTHAHLDHSAWRASPCGSERRCWRTATRRSPAMARLAAEGGIGGGEVIDAGFRPDRRTGEGAVVAGPGWTLTALATPGHTADHLGLPGRRRGRCSPATW